LCIRTAAFTYFEISGNAWQSSGTPGGAIDALRRIIKRNRFQTWRWRTAERP
jgi:hypothetical protein